ncbi:anti-phage defense-associated sirtuin Dsr1 [Pseudomonas sp. NPDC088368]|uniref:anti-phage defense-associated sirtuin Dsr1 n=1 Tax=Pseudomonas sp. NPDC088368 TaxID=3364453 RepID=UPI0038285A50
MQFVANGPEIPSELLQAHEDGRVVFFCGAGISYPAKLPGFEGLVQQIYKGVGTDFSDIEKRAFDKQQFDATLDLLERRLPGQRNSVREALARSLKPNLRLKNATRTHEAMLRLARTRTGVMRLVTTNFDRIFDAAAKKMGQSHQYFSAPMLPVPKASRWDGLVYLHGVLPKKPDLTMLNRLVVTSGDFGLAYLTERWASRFVGELFRNYVVCFVGYSINDPVLRYMMDALAADRMLGEVTLKAWAFADCNPGQEHEKEIEWEAKGVSPILYSVPAGTYDHSALHDSLHAWGETYRDGVTGKERIVVTHALARPSASTSEDDFVGRMLWALSDRSGLPARRFADLEPVPPLDWLLETYTDARFRHGDLEGFGVTADHLVDQELKFSLVRRPTRYSLAPLMDLRAPLNSESGLDAVMFQLARWLTRHLDDPRLAIWVAGGGGRPHERLCYLIEDRLELITRLERKGLVSELDEIRRHAPAGVPRLVMRTLWRIMLSGLIKSGGPGNDLYRWVERLRRDGLTASLKLEFRSLLAPRITIRELSRWENKQEEEPSAEPRTAATNLNQIVNWELVLASDHVYSVLGELEGHHWQIALPALLDDIQQCLRDALDLARELGAASDYADRSFWDLPSIIPHWQNRRHHDWVSVIELLRDSWSSVKSIDPTRAARVAVTWFDVPYPTFKRLSFFAVSQGANVSQEEWVGWLLRDNSRWLWDVHTKREVLRLIVLQGNQLSKEALQSLETAIRNGPPKEKYEMSLDKGLLEKYESHDVWLYLSKLEESGAALTDLAHARLADLRRAFPDWRLGSHERDEFSHWMSGTGDPDYDESREINIAPTKRVDLVVWLQQSPTSRWGFYEDTWGDVCRKHPVNAGLALQDLAEQDVWPISRWNEALQVWRADRLARRSWRSIAALVMIMPEHVLRDLGHGVSGWLEAITKTSGYDEQRLQDVSIRIFQMFANEDALDARMSSEPVTEAINHPVGMATQALVNIWFSRKPRDKDGLPADLKPIFKMICNTQFSVYQHGRVLLAANLIALYRVDPSWTESHLIPLMSWTAEPQNARAIWEGFLWSPRLHQQLLTVIKPQLLETAAHYDELGVHASQFSTFLTYVALGPVSGYGTDEFRTAIAQLPISGLEQVAKSLAQALGGAAEQREDYWRNRVEPFWRLIWPKTRELVTENIGQSLARLCLAAGDEFPAAFGMVKDWLLPFQHGHFIVKTLMDSGLCTRYPLEALRFLATITGELPWVPRELETCLVAISAANGAVQADPEYCRLVDYHRRYRG